MRKMHDKPARQRDVDALKPTCYAGGMAKRGRAEVSELRLESRVGSGAERAERGRQRQRVWISLMQVYQSIDVRVYVCLSMCLNLIKYLERVSEPRSHF